MDTGLYLPLPNELISYKTFCKFHNNIISELKAGFLSHEEYKYLADYYRDAGLLRNWKRPFFYHHHVKSFYKASQYLCINEKPCRILDLGCGVGTQSLSFALLGAEVIGLDMNEKALAILEKRKIFYEKQSGRQLEIQVNCTDALTFNYELISPINCVFSKFSCISREPQFFRRTNLLTKGCAADASLAVLDTNFDSLLFKIRKLKKKWMSKVDNPKKIIAELESQNWEVLHHGGSSIFPILWRILPNNILSSIDNKLSSTSLFPVSFLILAKRKLHQSD